MTDRKALASAIALYRDRAFVVLELSPELATIVEAAETYLAQLPEKCGTCGGTGARIEGRVDQKTFGSTSNAIQACPICHGRGTLYPARAT